MKNNKKSLSNTTFSTAERKKALSRRGQQRRRYHGASSEKVAISAAEVAPKAARDQYKTRLFERIVLVLKNLDTQCIVLVLGTSGLVSSCLEILIFFLLVLK